MSAAGPGKYKDTVALPDTAFPMRGDLAKREPEILARWQAEDLYGAIQRSRAEAPTFVLHDGPPYSNGNIHYGHILNKILKDLVVKHKTMSGLRAPYIPGWDTHGLPIELAVERELGPKRRDLSQAEVRQACRDYALRFVDIQRAEFQRLGVFGAWDQPYLTLSPVYERAIVKALAAFARGGYLYRGKKPVYWCPRDRTALAEAEIEYKDKTSPSVYVRFPLPGVDGAALAPALAGKRVALPIWTTTPWTLPANLAIVAKPELGYVALPSPRDPDEVLVCARELAEPFAKAIGAPELVAAAVAIEEDALRALEGARYVHPFVAAPSADGPEFRLWFADYVTVEQGTGLVHTAPGHGADDYKTGMAHGLPPYAPLDDAGRYTAEAPDWLVGKTTDEANPLVIERLIAEGALLNPGTDRYGHSYPHCWRCKGPILFRATAQWFISIDHDGFRQRALDAIAATTWIPAWGENRITAMIANRPDWVLSRQRLWGTPIPAFHCGACGQPHAEAATMDHVAELFGREGADAWWTRPSTELVPPGTRCACGAGPEQLEKEMNIVDVWFESGVSWMAIADQAADHGAIDLYLEGSDQHRGWFHSSLLAGIGVAGRPPYKQVLTHGFVLDSATGTPYSKSEIAKAKAEGRKVNYVPPDDVIAKGGAELFRLWVASTDFRNDIPYSQTQLETLSEWYRKLRNTARFLLGNLAGFTPGPDDRALVASAGVAVDRYLLAHIDDLTARVRDAYERYEFHTAHRAIVEFVTVTLSAFYGDVVKDRMYCDGKASPRRRSAQVVQYEAARALTLLVAPVLCFTAEDLWTHLPKRDGDPASVHLATYPAGAALDAQAPVVTTFATIMAWRERVQKALEPFRAAKHKSTDARVTVRAGADHAALAAFEAAHPGELAELFVVSAVALVDGDGAAVEVAEHGGQRCERCWRYYDALATAPADICQRCADAVGAQ